MRIISLCILALWASVVEAKGKEEGSLVRFEFAANTSLVLVPVYVNGHGPYQFLLDTGASHTVLSMALADKLEIRSGRTERLITAGGAVPVTIRTLEALQVAAVRIERPQIAVADLTLLGRLHADGILGGDYLKSFNLFIDYARQLLRLQVSPLQIRN